MSPAELANVIRFHLGELRARNGHHEFEHLCRHLARARIYSNILPATGPVGAGGDQGLDFETFRSRVPFPALPGFKDRSSTGKVGFCCSLETKIEPKIRADVRTIVEHGPVAEIVHFCESNLPVSRRHKLQAWARQKYDIDLQIFDGAAIAELLAERDVFWIAQEFLHIPAETMPAAPDQDEWYAMNLERWLSRSPLVVSNSDFTEIKFGLRRATFHDDARPRLPLWIGLMERFLDPLAPRPLQRSAMYELAVAYLRGRGDMTPQLQRIRDYYGDFEQSPSIADLQDAATLMSYAFGGWSLGQFDADPRELFAWRQRLTAQLDREIAEAPGHGRRSGLLSIRGFLQIVPEAAGAQPPIERSFDDWEKMLDEAELTPLFPIEKFARDLSKLTPQIGRYPRFEALADRADDLLAKRQGPAAAAENTFERAKAFYEADQLLEAIRDLHRVQLRWFTGDSMLRFQQASFLLSKCYLEIGLAYAAKNVALAAAFVARHSDDAEVAQTLPTMLFTAADADDGAGNSLSFLQGLLVALDAHIRLDADPLHGEKHPTIETDFGQTTALRGMAERSGPDQLAAVDEALSAWPESIREPMVRASRDPAGFWLKGSWDEIWKTFEENFIDRPFGDLGKSRVVSWRALGVRWSAAFANDHATTGVAEEFIAELQIALAALAELDLCLLPVNLQLNLSISPRARSLRMEECKSQSDASRLHVDVKLAGAPKPMKPQGSASATLAAVAGLIHQVSVLPSDTLLDVLKNPLLVAAGRVQIARPYRELYGEFTDAERFNEAGRAASTPLQPLRNFNSREHPLLAAKAGPGPTYSREEALDRIRIRYEKCAKAVGHTVQALSADEDKRGLLQEWHKEGLRDWEILSVVANAAMNIRHPLTDSSDLSEEEIARLRAMFDIDERPDTALAPGLFPDNLLRLNRLVFHGALLRSWNLEIPTSSPVDGKALEAFLVERYGLRSDDVEHHDVFGWRTDDQDPAH